MFELSEAFAIAAMLIASGDADLFEIILLSLRVSGTAVMIGCLIGFPVGAALATYRFMGRSVAIVVVNTLMGLPPVVVGLAVYLALSNSGPFGWLRLLYTPKAMIIAQVIIVAPIVAALSRQVIEDLHARFDEQLRSLGVDGIAQLRTLLYEARYALVTVVLAAFGRAIAEVGAVIIVGGNINHLTRVMTTAIALETSRGDLALAMALGIVLMAIALIVNACVAVVKRKEPELAYA
jgi:tungstate transport system permease protein